MFLIFILDPYIHDQIVHTCFFNFSGMQDNLVEHFAFDIFQ